MSEDKLNPRMHRDDPNFVLPSKRGPGYTKQTPKFETDAYQGYLSALLIHLEDEYEHTGNVIVRPIQASHQSSFPRDIRVTHPAGNIGDEIRILTEDVRSARIVDITGASRVKSDVPDDADRDYIELYIQPEVPDELMETEEVEGTTDE